MANAKKMNFVILGLLSHEPMTGYDIKKVMDTQLSMFWGASFGSIYPTLSEMLSQGLITKENISTNDREKLQYTITQKGHEFLHEWLVLPVEKDELRYETLLKLFFGSENGPAGTIKHIEAFEEKIASQLVILKRSVQILEQILHTEDAHLYYLLAAKFGVTTYEGYLNWCSEAKEILRQKELG